MREKWGGGEGQSTYTSETGFRASGTEAIGRFFKKKKIQGGGQVKTSGGEEGARSQTVHREKVPGVKKQKNQPARDRYLESLSS